MSNGRSSASKNFYQKAMNNNQDQVCENCGKLKYEHELEYDMFVCPARNTTFNPKPTPNDEECRLAREEFSSKERDAAVAQIGALQGHLEASKQAFYQMIAQRDQLKRDLDAAKELLEELQYNPYLFEHVRERISNLLK